ncbi:unnamed protein product [Cuscuta epithymum]|uniref:Uncharacterized protein n=1 Tax=Cuscuta epithymum TaxID=186058 RepID=A0AAV0D3R7_9ASTE|nr:unnamed protein product [Cuscuta epithymum]
MVTVNSYFPFHPHAASVTMTKPPQSQLVTTTSHPPSALTSSPAPVPLVPCLTPILPPGPCLADSHKTLAITPPQAAADPNRTPAAAAAAAPNRTPAATAAPNQTPPAVVFPNRTPNQSHCPWSMADLSPTASYRICHAPETRLAKTLDALSSTSPPGSSAGGPSGPQPHSRRHSTVCNLKEYEHS